jgi:hypothetical protein
MNFCKYLLSFCFFVATAHSEPIIISHFAPKASGGEVEMKYIGHVMTDAGLAVDYYATGQCADTAKFWNNAGTRPMVIAYSSDWARTEKVNGKPCTANLDGAYIVQRKTNPVWLCGGANPKPLSTPGLRVAILSTAPGQDIVADINQHNSWSWHAIPVTQSFRESIMQLMNGDVDYILWGQAGTGLLERHTRGEIKCIASSMPHDQLPYLAQLLHMSGNADLALTKHYIVAAKNLSPAELKTVVNQLDPTKNQESQRYYNFNDFKITALDADNARMVSEFWYQVYRGLEEYKK